MSVYAKHILYDIYGVVLDRYTTSNGGEQFNIHWTNGSPDPGRRKYPTQIYNSWDVVIVDEEEYLAGIVLGS